MIPRSIPVGGGRSTRQPVVECDRSPLFAGFAAPQRLDPRYCLLGSTAGYDPSNPAGSAADLVSAYENLPAGQQQIPEAGTSLTAAPAFDEGGNFIDVRFRPLTLSGDYHLAPGSAGNDAATKDNPLDGTSLLQAFPLLGRDWDGDARSGGNSGNWDIGADER